MALLKKTMTNICEENQKKFDNAWDLYWHQIDAKDKSSLDFQWKVMWECVYLACMNHGKRMIKDLLNANGDPIQVQDLDGKCQDACIKIMLKVKEGLKPTLSAYPYLWVYGEIFGIKQQRWDQSGNTDDFMNVAYYCNEDNIYFLEGSNDRFSADSE